MASGNPDTELLTEHFGYPPVSLLDEIINSINILADKALTSVETGLLNAPPTSIGFGNTASTNANSKSKRKRKQHPDEEDDNGVVSDLSPEQIEDQAHAEIAAGTHQLETLLCTSIDRNFDKFELYVMRNILCVKPEDRDWIRLGHYDGLNFDNLPATVLPGAKKNSAAAGAGAGNDKDKDKDNNNKNNDGNGEKMDIDSSSAAHATSQADNDDEDVNPDIPTITSVNKLRRRLQASQKLNALLAAEKTRNDALLNELRSIAGRTTKAAAATAHATSEDNSTTTTTPPLAFLHNKGDLTQADAATPLTTTTAFALSQMQALRALSTSLSNILPDLNTSLNVGVAADTATAASEGEGDATKTTTVTTRRTWRKERVEYIEGAARRHLEAVRGLELDPDGEIRDGEWQGEGPRVGAEEFAALEGVLDLLDKKVVSTEGKSNGSGSGNGDVDVDVGDNGDNAGMEDDDDAAKQGAATAS